MLRPQAHSYHTENEFRATSSRPLAKTSSLMWPVAWQIGWPLQDDVYVYGQLYETELGESRFLNAIHYI